MRPIFIAAILAFPAGCATAHHEESGPAGIPYLCNDDQPVRAIYLDGGWTERGRVRLSYGGWTIELRAAPTAQGLRYAGIQENVEVTWQVDGEEALLTQFEPNVRWARQCVRVRDGAVPAAEAPDHH